MSLTNRLSVYALVSLAVILAGFSTALYFLAAIHLHRQADHRLEAAMQTLVASTEVFPDRIEWEPLLRRITLGDDSALDQIRWTAHSPDGRMIDCSRNLEQPDSANLPAVDARTWRVLAARVAAGDFQPRFLDGWESPRVGSLAEPFPTGESPGSTSLHHDRTFTDRELILIVALSEEPIEATLRQLALWLGLLSSGVWLVAAVGGRWICRRALAPVTRMANTARAIRRGSDEKKFLDVASTRDELEDLGIAFNELLADLRESLARRQRFAGDASHQLRTPLGAMLAAVDVVLRQERTPEEYRRALDAVRRRGGQLTQIIEMLLFLARPDHASVLPEPECIELVDWCRRWLEGWHSHSRAADIRLQPDEGPIRIHTYPALLGQVLDNLLDNACKYSEPGTPVTIRLNKAKEFVTLSVVDQGCGIDEADHARVFEAFFRSDKARWLGKPGTGLGLTVACRLVRILGGALDVTSSPGQGSEFRIRLPRAARFETPEQAAESEFGHQPTVLSANFTNLEDQPGVYKSPSESADSIEDRATASASLTGNMGNLQ